MKNYIVINNGFVGFGTSQEDAKFDSFINECRIDLNNDREGYFKERRAKLAPWLPKPNMLHISGVGCLIYEDYYIHNKANGKSILALENGMPIYYCIAELFGNKLSYEDITVVIRPELDLFFKSISEDICLVKDMPPIKLEGTDNGFNPEQVYILNNGIIIGLSESAVGVKLVSQDMYHTVDVEDSNNIVAVISYICCKMNILFNKTEVVVRSNNGNKEDS